MGSFRRDADGALYTEEAIAACLADLQALKKQNPPVENESQFVQRVAKELKELLDAGWSIHDLCDVLAKYKVSLSAGCVRQNIKKGIAKPVKNVQIISDGMIEAAMDMAENSVAENPNAGKKKRGRKKKTEITLDPGYNEPHISEITNCVVADIPKTTAEVEKIKAKIMEKIKTNNPNIFF